jgi:GDP-4-dehydro-6-deoxy-D-mannose reductase
VEIKSDKSRMRPVDISILIGSCERLSADTGWKPVIPIETTLSDSLKFWRHHLIEEVEDN